MVVQVYIDGGYRPTLKTGAYAFFAKSKSFEWKRKSELLNCKSSDEAEFAAFVFAVLFLKKKLKNIKNTQLIFYTDSQRLHNFFYGKIKLKNRFSKRVLELKNFNIILNWIPRNSVPEHYMCDLMCDSVFSKRQSILFEMEMQKRFLSNVGR